MAGVKRRNEFFEVSVSPMHKKPKISDPPSVLILAPFTAVPKVCFSNVKVGSEVKAAVILKNPSDLYVDILLTLSDELQNIGLELNAVQFSIAAGGIETLEIWYKPSFEDRCRGKINVKHLNGDKKFSYITLTCSSVSVNTRKGGQKGVKASQNPQQKKLQRKSTAEQLNCPSLPVTPTRRETYGVTKPTYPASGLISIRTPQVIQASNKPSVEDDLETVFGSSKIVSSSPQASSSKTFGRIRVREPLKEYNYNTRPVVIKQELEYEKSPAVNRMFDSSCNFDRDSLEPAWNENNSPNFDNLSFTRDVSSSSHYTKDPNWPEQKPFYLNEPFSEDLTFNINDSLFQDIKPPVFPQKSGEVSQSMPDVSGNENFYSLCKSESTFFGDATYQLNNSSPASLSPVGNLADQIPAERHVSFASCHQPVSFDISPARPVFKKSMKPILKREKKELTLQKSDILESHHSQEFLTRRPASADSKISEIKNTITLYDTPDYLLHPYGVTTIPDPFSRRTIHPREWIEKLELELIKWLNSLLTPPREFGSITEGVDVKKLWDQSTAASLKIAPSREAASKDYVLSDCTRMAALRKTASALMKSGPIKQTLYHIQGKIDSGFLSVKDDISLYHNQGARVKIVQMCMYYNPLWLKIALEVLYGQYITLEEKHVHRGLVYFLRNNFLSDQTIKDKHKFFKSNHPQGAAFVAEMNNFIVLKFLTLILFLDQAKINKIMPYDPCLFCKDSPIKESEGMLNEFVKEFLKCVGQFKKTLNAIGFKLEYKQTYLDEFDYGLSSHLDLRDGIRLTRAMERILKDPSYSQRLWTPTVSRIQKLHNVQVALSALKDNGYEISSGIAINDIVKGHREKIYSLLWQIVHGFLAPRYQTAARRIQAWWRKQYLGVLIRKRIDMKKKVIKIQAYARGYLYRKHIKQMHSAATTIQNWFRKKNVCLIERKRFLQMRHAAIKIQTWYKSILLTRKDRQQFLLLRQSTIIIQRCYRNHILMKVARTQYLRERKAVIKVQRLYRTKLLLKKERLQFLAERERRNAAIKIQNWFRALMKGRLVRKEFLEVRKSTVIIQNYYRSYLKTKACRAEFLAKKSATLVIQKWYRRTTLFIKERNHYLKLRESTLLIQKWFRSVLVMKAQRNSFLKKKKAAMTIQRWYRNQVGFRDVRRSFLKQRSAAVKIQRAFRNYRLSKSERAYFLLMKESSVVIQRYYRSYLKMKVCREGFLEKKQSAVIIQQWFRGIKQMRENSLKFQAMREAAKMIQLWYRNILATKTLRKTFLLKRHSAIKIQRWYRRLIILRKAKEAAKIEKAASTVQAAYRGYLARKNLKAQLMILAQRAKKRSKQKGSNRLILAETFKHGLNQIHCYYKQPSRDLASLVRAYRDIELCTIYSPVLCVELCSNITFFERLWADLNQGLRSGPYLDLFRHGLNIIMKLCKFSVTRDELLKIIDMFDGYNILCSLMGKFMEKNTDIFCKAASIFWLLLGCYDIREEVKKKLDLKRFYFYFKQVSSKQGNKNGTLPTKKIDWGYADKSLEFTNIRQACEELKKLIEQS